MALTRLNNGNFYETIKNSSLPAIVDFYADWCQPCKRIAPLLEEIAEEYAGKVLVYQVNVDEEQDLAGDFNIVSIPFVLSFKNGEPYKHLVGVSPKQDFLALIE
jgi:thioredoxin 1